MSVPKISREELIRRISDPNQPLSELADNYLKIQYDGERGVKVDAENLLVDESRDNPLTQANIAFDWVVKAHRARRQNIFFSRLEQSPDDPIVILDGDSWAQHPFVDEIFNQLTGKFNVFCSSLAGRKMQELHDENKYIEMLDTLVERRKLDKVAAIVLSGGGNDLFGEQLGNILKPFDNSRPDDPLAHINDSLYQELNNELSDYYTAVIRKIRTLYNNFSFPIILHSYTYLTPWDKDGGVVPKDKWIGDPMRRKGITDLALQKSIVIEMVDRFHAMLEVIANDSDNIILLDNRDLVPGDNSLWSDEIHPSSEGFKRVGEKIKSKITA